MNKDIPNTTVLAYHNILSPGSDMVIDKSSIPFDRLEEHIRVLQETGFSNVSLAQAFDKLVKDRDKSDRLFYAITFDDGYENLFFYLPELLDHIKPTVFHIAEYTGKSNLIWNTRTPLIQKHLTIEQILELDKLGVDIEYHGLDHHNLLKFDRQELHHRFEAGLAWFEENLPKKPWYISYPYGYCDKRVCSIASEYFRGGVTVNHGAWSGLEAQYALNRISVPYYLTGHDLVEIILTAPGERWYEIERRAPWRKEVKCAVKSEK